MTVLVRCQPMKWNVRYEGYETAQVGHLFCNIKGNGGYKHAGHPDYEPETFNWYIAPDDEDKAYRRAIEDGNAESMEAAKCAVDAAIRKIAADIVAALEDA